MVTMTASSGGSKRIHDLRSNSGRAVKSSAWSCALILKKSSSALCRSPARDVPCHKSCAETWITTHARDAAHLARLIAGHTPNGGAR